MAHYIQHIQHRHGRIYKENLNGEKRIFKQQLKTHLFQHDFNFNKVYLILS